MRIFTLAVIAALTCFGMTSCDDTTDTLGASLTDNLDLLKVTTDTFNVSSRSLTVDSVLSRNTIGYLGKIRDPETGDYITGDFMAQFNTLENYHFPDKDSIASLLDGEIIADSCHIRLFYTNYYGDSLATMNLTAYEMARPMEENTKYYSNFDPIEEGLVRTDGLKVNKTYTLTDMSISSDIRYDETEYTPNIKIDLNMPYTDNDGVTYNNYGTYIMRKYYEDPSRFKNSYKFIHEVCPGFYFKVNDGLGSMAYVDMSQLNIYFKFKNDTVLTGTSSFSGTEEVLQTTNVTTDKQALKKLAADNSCTYIKSPAGIFTELQIPVDEICFNHENDTINSATITLQRINNNVDNKYSLKTPTTLLMIPKDSIISFFEHENIVDYKRSFIATYSTTDNSYTFNNIAGMVSYMANNKQQGMKTNANWLADNPDWDKVVIIPVTITTNSSGQIVKVVHDMGLTSTRLIGGSENAYKPIRVSVIYSKFNHD